MFSFQIERTDEELDNLMHLIVKEKYDLIFNKESSATKYERPERVPDIPPLPLELFRRDSVEERRNLFFKGLERGDVLWMQVVNSLPDSYKLWVLAKHTGCTKVDDLGLVVHLPKLKPEMKLLGSELNKGDFIKAALCSCSLHERKLYVTLDETLLTMLGDDAVKLGPISYHDLPYYVGSFKNCLSYVGYVHRSEAFYNPGWNIQMCEVLGFKENHVYSFFEELQGKTYPKHEYASELKKKQQMNQSVKCYDRAVTSYAEKNIEETFAFLNKALDLNPKNVQALTTRGTVYANVTNLRKAFVDTEAALALDKNFAPAKKQMSKLLIALARTHLEAHNYPRAQECLRMSSDLDGNNVELTESLLDLIPSKVRNLNKPTDDSSVFRVPKAGSSRDQRSLSKESSHSKKESSHSKKKSSHSKKESSHSKKKERKYHRRRSHHYRSGRHDDHRRRDGSRPRSSRSTSADSGTHKTADHKEN